jgi:trehalose synthase
VTASEVAVATLDLERFRPIVGDQRYDDLAVGAAATAGLLEGRTVWHVNSTAAGGGVAEMLQPLLGYARGAGVDARWLVIGGDAEFFRITKRLHNGFHGVAGDGGDLGPAERAHYCAVLEAEAADVLERVSPGDPVVLHDPQTAGLVPAVAATGSPVVWRCHIGSDVPNELVERSWNFIRQDIEGADAHVLTRAEYAPPWMSTPRIIPPSIDPFSPKNREMSGPEIGAVLARVGLPEGPLVVQVSRWDRLKDMQGVMRGFVENVEREDVHLALVGPDVSGVADDPEGAEVFQECIAAWSALSADLQPRVHLVSLPMEDLVENGLMVNAIQRSASVVVQKSLAEGFGLTVTEAMWKRRPVVASAVGGIRDQIEHGRHGLLLDDPADLTAFGQLLDRLLSDADLADGLAAAAHDRVVDRFLGTRHLVDWADLITELVATR